MEIATHNGDFHTDDVFAIAVLGALYPEAKVVRTRDEAKLAQADIVVDVGKKFDVETRRFDHHQKQAGTRPNGIIYSGFGLIWREYGKAFCEGNEEVWRRIDEKLVQHVDAHDNGQKTYQTDKTGVEPFLIEDVVRLYNPSPLDQNEADTHDERFKEAVKFARHLLYRMKKVEAEAVAAEEQFLKLYEQASDKRFIVLDKHLPFKSLINQLPELLYVIYPYATGESWMVQAVPQSPTSFESRKPFPEAWRGAGAHELQQLTGVDDVVFCHATGFIAGAVSQNGAKALMQRSLEA